MGILNKTRVYLAGYMEAGDGTKWRNIVEGELKPRGVSVLNPYDKPWLDGTLENQEIRDELKIWVENDEHEKVAEYAKKIRREDLRCVDISDFLIVYIDPKIPTFGTMEELTVAVKECKPVFLIVVGGIKKCPLWIRAMLSIKYCYNSLDEALNMIKKIDDSLVSIDSDKWHLLKPEYR